MSRAARHSLSFDRDNQPRHATAPEQDNWEPPEPEEPDEDDLTSDDYRRPILPRVCPHCRTWNCPADDPGE